MDAVQFQQQASENAPLMGLLNEVADEAAPHVGGEQPLDYSLGGVDLLAAAAAYALFRWAKDFLDHRRAQKDTQVAAQRLELVRVLTQQDHLSPKVAQAIVESLLKGIEKRGQNDPALKAALALASRGE